MKRIFFYKIQNFKGLQNTGKVDQEMQTGVKFINTVPETFTLKNNNSNNSINS